MAKSDKLAPYRRKRDFTRTPEPRGKSARRAGAPLPRFCVQKHLASHLHYDVRLEHDGVLWSWAVPKGPSLDPRQRRLAMQTEDHPVDYLEFEGVIPEGYGAGIVMLWDLGTWECEGLDAAASMARGEIKFELQGIKLKGHWLLVRARSGSEDKPQWLLIKKRDDWSGPLDVTRAAPRSVKSKGDFADILADEKADVWESDQPAHGGATGAMLRKVMAQAAKLRAKRPAPRRSKSTRASKSDKP
jgi:bifunctional non-homologous end joining protein LigD